MSTLSVEVQLLSIFTQISSLFSFQIIDISIAVGLYQAFKKKAALKRTDQLVNQDDPDYGEQNNDYMDPDGAYTDFNNMDFVDSNQLAYQQYNQNQPVQNY